MPSSASSRCTASANARSDVGKQSARNPRAKVTTTPLQISPGGRPRRYARRSQAESVWGRGSLAERLQHRQPSRGLASLGRGRPARIGATSWPCAESAMSRLEAPGPGLRPLRVGDPERHRPTVGRRARLPVGPGGRIRLEAARLLVGEGGGRSFIGIDPGALRRPRLERRESGGTHQPLGDQSLGDGHVPRAPGTPLPTRRHPLGASAGVERVADAVDPAEAEHLVDHLFPGDGGLAGRLFVITEPQLVRRLVVGLEPVTKLASVGEELDVVGSRRRTHQSAASRRSSQARAT